VSIERFTKPVQSVVDLAKSALWVLLLAYAFLEGRGALQSVLAEISEGRTLPSEVTLGKDGFTVKLEQAKANLSAALNTQVAADGKQDKPVASGLKPLATALEGTESALAELRAPSKASSQTQPAAAASPGGPARGSWVYMGVEKDGVWNPDYFHAKGQPAKGQEIAAVTDVFKRDGQPTHLAASDDWKLGKVVGVLRPNQRVRVVDVASIPSDNGGLNWWACVWPVAAND
jgi:hypothetical protein